MASAAPEPHGAGGPPDGVGDATDTPDVVEAEVVEEADATEEVEKQTERVKDLSRRSRSTRTDVSRDFDDGDGSKDVASLPGVNGFGAISRVAPFLWLWATYASHLYPKHKSERARHAAFMVHHPWIVRLSFVADAVVRVILVTFVLMVILKGVWPPPWIH